jgi:hypothetical protein
VNATQFLKQLTESLFYGVWKSYKAFQKSGNVANHTKANYLEFNFKADKQLLISRCSKGKDVLLNNTKDWAIIFKDNRHYLSIDGKVLMYEVITINHTTLVLMQRDTYEKFFCARPQTWEHYIESKMPSAL